jgi:hypothetical protein
LRACETNDFYAEILHHNFVGLATNETGSPSGRPLVEAEAKKARAALVLEPPASGGR